MLTLIPFEINIDILVYVLVGVGVVLIALLLWIIRLEIRIKRLLSGKNARSLEDTIANLKMGQSELERFRSQIETYLEDAERRLQNSVQGVGMVRFNPFKGIGAGGNQSFATAFLNEHGDGVVISALYARDRMSVYSKAIRKYTSNHELTDEEKSAIQHAKENGELK